MDNVGSVSAAYKLSPTKCNFAGTVGMDGTKGKNGGSEQIPPRDEEQAPCGMGGVFEAEETDTWS